MTRRLQSLKSEWGFLNPRFPNSKGQTLSQGLQEVIDAFDDLAKRIAIGPMLFYSYNSGLTDADGHPSGLVDAKGDFTPAAKVLAARAAR